MKKDTIIWAGAALLGGIFVLPKIINYFNGVDDSGFLNSGGIADVLDSGGSVSTTQEAGLPWWSFVSPLSMITGYAMDASGAGDVTQTIKGSTRNPDGTIKIKSSYSPNVKGFSELPTNRAIAKIKRSSGVNSSSGTASQKEMLSMVSSHLKDTKTTNAGKISGMTQARIASRIKYGGWGGR